MENELSLVLVANSRSPTKHVRCHPGGLSNQHHGKVFAGKINRGEMGKVFSPPKTHGDFLQTNPYGSQVPLIKNHVSSLKIAAVIYSKYNRIYFTPTICPPSPLKSSELDSLAFLYIPPKPHPTKHTNKQTNTRNSSPTYLTYHSPTTHQPLSPPLRSATLEAPRSWKKKTATVFTTESKVGFPKMVTPDLVTREERWILGVFFFWRWPFCFCRKKKNSQQDSLVFTTFAGWNLGWFGVFSSSSPSPWWFQPSSGELFITFATPIFVGCNNHICQTADVFT